MRYLLAGALLLVGAVGQGAEFTADELSASVKVACSQADHPKACVACSHHADGISKACVEASGFPGTFREFKQDMVLAMRKANRLPDRSGCTGKYGIAPCEYYFDDAKYADLEESYLKNALDLPTPPSAIGVMPSGE